MDYYQNSDIVLKSVAFAVLNLFKYFVRVSVIFGQYWHDLYDKLTETNMSMVLKGPDHKLRS